MLVNILVVNILVGFFTIIILFQLFLANSNKEGYLAVVPVIKPIKTTIVNKPVNTSYANIKVTQDFDPDSVFTNFKSSK
jgi:hypothetical protein